MSFIAAAYVQSSASHGATMAHNEEVMRRAGMERLQDIVCGGLQEEGNWLATSSDCRENDQQCIGCQDRQNNEGAK